MLITIWGVGRPTGCCQLLRKMKILRVIKKKKSLDTAREVCHVDQCTVLHLILSRVISSLQKWHVSFSDVVTEDDCFWLRRCDRSTSSSSSVTSSEPRPTEKVKMQHVNLKEKWRVDYPWLRTDTDMFCAMCQDTRQKNGFTRGSSNCGFWAFYKSGSYQGQPTEYEGSFWCSMCQGKWLHRSSAGPVFSLGGGSLPMLILVLLVLCTALHVGCPCLHHHTGSQKS